MIVDRGPTNIDSKEYNIFHFFAVFLCDLENDIKTFYKQFLDFWHKMKTKT